MYRGCVRTNLTAAASVCMDMSERELCIQLDDNDDDFSDSDFSDGYDASLDLELEGNYVPYITSPVFPDLPKLKDSKNPWRVNANGIQICDASVGNDSDFAETKEIGLQVVYENQGQYLGDSDETDDKELFNNIDSYDKIKSTENNIYYSEESDPAADDTTTVLDTTHKFIEAAGNVQINRNLESPGSQINSNCLNISDEFNSKYSLSDTDIECNEDSSEGDIWQQPEVRHEENRRWIGVSPAKFRLLRRSFYD